MLSRRAWRRTSRSSGARCWRRSSGGGGRARAVDDAFLLGDELLAAPCFSERADATRDVYIPAGHAWVHLFTGQRHDCTARPCDLRAESAPFGAPLVFAREGGALVPRLRSLGDCARVRAMPPLSLGERKALARNNCSGGGRAKFPADLLFPSVRRPRGGY